MAEGRVAQAAGQASELLALHEVARGIVGVRFAKPEGFVFQAGQHLTLRLPEGPDLRGEDREHMFSIAAAPHEPDLLIVTRLRDHPWKRALQALEPGAPLEVEGPGGHFTLHADTAVPVAFLAGGIGITPFRSLLLDAAQRRTGHRITLVYSSTSPEATPFLDELKDLQGKVPGFELVATMTGDVGGWGGERGRIDADLLRRHLGSLEGHAFYIAGPPDMVRDLKALVVEQGVRPQRVKVEEFSGY